MFRGGVGGVGGAGSGQAHVRNCATIKQEGGTDSRLGLGCVRTDQSLGLD